jgi:hypothetical protein
MKSRAEALNLNLQIGGQGQHRKAADFMQYTELLEKSNITAGHWVKTEDERLSTQDMAITLVVAKGILQPAYVFATFQCDFAFSIFSN